MVEKIGTLPNQMIHIMFKCVVHLHGHRNKVVPFMKPSIFANFSNSAKFYWLINDTQSHHLSHWVNHHHIDNKNLVLSNYVKIDS
jgi:hypothetical protein